MNLLIKMIQSKTIRNAGIILFLIVAFLWLWRNNENLRADNQRLSADVLSISSGLKEIKLQNGKLAVQTDAIILRTSELKTLFPAQAKSIQDLGAKANKAAQFSKTVIETQKNIVTVLRDSTIHDTIRVKVFSYSDQFYQISGIAQGDSQSLHICSTDTLVQVVYKGERINPWLWIFSPRKLQQRVTLSNPNATIKYSQLIQIQNNE